MEYLDKLSGIMGYSTRTVSGGYSAPAAAPAPAAKTEDPVVSYRLKLRREANECEHIEIELRTQITELDRKLMDADARGAENETIMYYNALMKCKTDLEYVRSRKVSAETNEIDIRLQGLRGSDVALRRARLDAMNTTSAHVDVGELQEIMVEERQVQARAEEKEKMIAAMNEAAAESAQAMNASSSAHGADGKGKRPAGLDEYLGRRSAETLNAQLPSPGVKTPIQKSTDDLRRIMKERKQKQARAEAEAGHE